MKNNDKTVEIGLVIYDDCLMSAVYGMTDLFRVANDCARQREGVQRPVIRISHWQDKQNGMECVYDTHQGAPNNPLMLIVAPSLIEPTKAQAAPPVVEFLVQKHQAGATICSVCAGSFLLAEAGLLKNRSATTHWTMADKMARLFPDIHVDTDKMIIDDGDIMTAGGIMAWVDLGLRLVQRCLGPTLMMDTARMLLVDPSGREQRHYSHFMPRLNHGDARILKVQHWLQASSAKEADVISMAKKAGMEERTFLRHFQKATGMKPTEYCQQIRIVKAREMLEFTKQNVEQISWAVGYEDPGAFRKVFHKLIGLTPGQYRDRFSMTT